MLISKIGNYRRHLLLHLQRKSVCLFLSTASLMLMDKGGRKVVDDSDDEEMTETKYTYPSTLLLPAN